MGGRGGTHLIGVAKNTDRWRALVNAVMNFWILENTRDFMTR